MKIWGEVVKKRNQMLKAEELVCMIKLWKQLSCPAVFSSNIGIFRLRNARLAFPQE